MTENELIKICDDYLRRDNIEAALDMCNQFIVANPLSAVGFRKRAAIYARQNDFDDAIEDMNTAIELNPNEASYYFFSGWWKLEKGNFVGAETDQSSAIEKEREQGVAFVSESAYFFRSLARLRLGKFHEALSDSKHVEDDFLIYLKSVGKVTKAEIVREASSNAQ